MKTLSIKEIIQSLSGTDKVYLTTYNNEGYELGFGEGGFYKGHSHYFFYDILFSPDKLFIKNEKKTPNNFLAIIPPRTFMNDVEIGNFFFIKFCPTNDSFLLPEKTDDVLLSGKKIDIYSDPIQLDFTWFKTQHEKLNINIVAEPNDLIITFENNEKLKVIG